jgi:hypothetical protein
VALAEKKDTPVRVLMKHQRATENDLPRWHIVEPYAFEVFFPRVEGILRAVLELRAIGPVSADEVSSSFGDQTFMELRFTTRDGKQRRVEIGVEHPMDTMDLVAVRVDGSDAFHTVGKFKRSVDVHLESLRSRALVPVPAEKMVRVEVNRPGEGSGFTVERRVGSLEWRFLPPHAGVADPELFGELLNKLNSWRVESFVADSIESPEEYGFDTPRMVFSLTERRGDGAGRVFQYEIAEDFGERLGDSEVYVRDPRRPFLYSSRVDVVAALERPVEEFRNRYVLQLGASRVVDINGTVRSFAGGEESSRKFRLWNENRPAVDPRPNMPREEGEFSAWKVQDFHLEKKFERQQRFKADTSTTAAFVRELARFPIARYMDDPADPAVQEVLAGGVPVELELEVITETTLKRLLKFYKMPENDRFAENSYLVTRDGTDEVVLVHSLLVADLSPGGIYFRDRNVSGIDSVSVQAFDVWNSRGKVWSLARIGDAWRVGDSDGVRMIAGKGLDETLVNSVVRGMSQGYFRVEAFLPDAGDEDQLEIVAGRWRASIHLTAVANPEGFTRITVGARRERSPGQEYYGKLDSIPDMPVLLTNDLVRRFIELIDHLEGITESP